MSGADGRTLRAVVAMVVVACGCALLLTTRAASGSGRELQDARTAHAAALAQSVRIAHLARQSASVGESRPTEPDLLARLNRCLGRAGVPESALRSHRASPPERIGTTIYERQTATITLDALRPAELAAVLHAWRVAEPLWTVRDIRFTHAGRGATDRYDATLVLESIILASHASSPKEQPR